MERGNQMHRQISAMRQSLFDQGFLDDQFLQLEELQDDVNPNFVEEVVTLYYRDSSRLLRSIEQALENGPYDFNKLDNFMHQFKGSSSSIGAKKVNIECGYFREYCRIGNGEGCIRSFQQLKREYAILKKKLETYFQVGLPTSIGHEKKVAKAKKTLDDFMNSKISLMRALHNQLWERQCSYIYRLHSSSKPPSIPDTD